MALFSRNYNKPGPGVNKDEPRKKGIRRFFEVFVRDLGNLVKLNFFFCICAAPSVALFLFAILGFGGGVSLPVLLLALVAAIPIGGAVTACYFCISKMLRDDPGFAWHDFKRKFKENFRSTMAMGMVCTFVVYMQIYTLVLFIGSEGAGLGLGWLIVYLLSLLLFGMITPYYFLQAGYLDLKLGGLLKNSVLLAFGNAPRSLMGALQGGIIWVLYAFFFPTSVMFAPFLLLIAFTLSWLLTLMWVWKPVDKQFEIEETLRKREREGLDED